MNDGKPALHQELEAHLNVFIADPANAMLPSERELIARFGVSRTTVRRAIQTLIQAGRVRPAHGKGNLIERGAPRRTGNILLLLREESERYQLEAFEALLGALSDAGLHALSVIVRDGESPTEKVAAALGEVDGVVLADWLSENRELRELLTTSGKRSAVLRHQPVTFPYDYAAEDKVEAFRLLAAHLAALGHRHVAFVSNRHDAGRLEGARRGLAEAGLELDPELVFDSMGRTPDGFKSAGRLLESGRPFTAVIAQNDECALGVMQRLMLAGIRVPEDVSLTGYDNLRESAHYPAPLTTCAGDLRRLCGQVVDFIASPFPQASLKSLVKPVLHVRASTSAVKRFG